MRFFVDRRRPPRRRRGARAERAPREAETPPNLTPPVAEAEPEAARRERTHLEQVMFQLAREHAEAAVQCAHADPPDRSGERTHSLVAILMAYFALEAFINMVGEDRLGSRFRYYDRMPPEGKWVEVTRLVSKTGQTFAEDGEELQALATLRTWRNMLTHYKGRFGQTGEAPGGETPVDALLVARNATRAVEIARTLYRRFYELDRRSPPRRFVWLDDRPRPTG